ncbi:MarR family transcriptional regulator [Robbsia sp. KACC 23696]|uniref:MarR family winged helix-turn-helix transcriptional regulator n=1 Tax=Robbsia sp. KACC 23696 TaxID=3149231 RepID=UPI00325BF964
MNGNLAGDVVDAPGRSIFDGIDGMQQRTDETSWVPARPAAIARTPLTTAQIDALNAAFDAIAKIVGSQGGDAGAGADADTAAANAAEAPTEGVHSLVDAGAIAARREALSRGAIALHDVVELARGVILGTRAADARTAAEPANANATAAGAARALSLDELCNDLAQACNRLSRDYTTGLCGHNEQKISAPEWRVLKCMSDWKDEHPQKLLVSTLGIDAGALTRVCQGLENGRGAINREPDARDNRLNNLCLTDQGRKLIDVATPQIATFHRRLQDAVASGPVLEFLYLLVNQVEQRFAEWSSSDQRARSGNAKN